MFTPLHGVFMVVSAVIVVCAIVVVCIVAAEAYRFTQQQPRTAGVVFLILAVVVLFVVGGYT